MNCRKVRKWLFSYFEKNLSEDKRKQIEDHLENCSACAQELSEIKSTQNLVQDLPQLKPSDDFNQRLLARIRNASFDPQPASKTKSKPVFSFNLRWAVGVATVVAALASTAIFGIFPFDKGKDTSSLIIEEQRRLDSLLAEESRIPWENLLQQRQAGWQRASQDEWVRFVMERVNSQALQQRRVRNVYVLPAVSSRQVTQKESY